MSNINKSLLESDGWKLCCSVSGDRLNGYSQITLYSDQQCTQSVSDIITRMVPYATRYCKLKFSKDLPNEPCLYMFVCYNHHCLIQIEEHSLSSSLHNCGVHIITDGSEVNEHSMPSTTMEIAYALEQKQKVYLCYWPLTSNTVKALLCSRKEFLTNFSNPVWDDSHNYPI